MNIIDCVKRYEEAIAVYSAEKEADQIIMIDQAKERTAKAFETIGLRVSDWNGSTALFGYKAEVIRLDVSVGRHGWIGVSRKWQCDKCTDWIYTEQKELTPENIGELIVAPLYSHFCARANRTIEKSKSDVLLDALREWMLENHDNF